MPKEHPMTAEQLSRYFVFLDTLHQERTNMFVACAALCVRCDLSSQGGRRILALWLESQECAPTPEERAQHALTHMSPEWEWSTERN